MTDTSASNKPTTPPIWVKNPPKWDQINHDLAERIARQKNQKASEGLANLPKEHGTVV